MPRRKSSEPLRRVLIPLYSRDYERLQSVFPDKGVAPAVRALVRGFLTRLDREVEDKVLLDELEIEID